MKKLFLALLLTFPLFADGLQLKEGFVAAHTEMMMDGTIDPLNNNLHADMSIAGDDLTSLRGKLWIEMKLFSSDNAKRDTNMHESNEVGKYPLASYTISDITKLEGSSYTINGKLDFHGQKRPFTLKAEITSTENEVTINATSSFLVSDYGMEMPCMMFMCVRDQVDIFAKAVLAR